MEDLWAGYRRTADSTVENALVEHYLPLVRSVVGRLVATLPPHVEFDDLYSPALVGLLQALRHYDPETGVPFECYARLRIRGAVLDELRRLAPMARSAHHRARTLEDATRHLEQELGRTPTETETANALGLTVAEYRRCADEARPVAHVCLDATSPMEEGDTDAHHEAVPDPRAANPAEEVARRELAAVVAQRLQHLPPMQRRVLALYYEEGLFLREIAEVLGVTESRVCQIHGQAILALKTYLRRYEAGRVATLARPGPAASPAVLAR